MSWRCFTCWLIKLWRCKMTSLVNKSADWLPNYHKILIFSPPKSLKSLCAARIDALADSNEPAISNTFCFKLVFSRTSKHIHTQECIPVGCVPAAHWLYAGGRSASRGGACSWGCLLPGGACSQEGVCLRGIPACTEAEPPPMNRITDLSKNITLTPTSLRPVKILF